MKWKSQASEMVGGLLQRQGMQSLVIVGVASVVANAGHWAFQFIMGKTLGVEEYGGLTSLLALFIFISIPSTGFQLSSARFASHARHKNNVDREVIGLLISLSKYGGIFGAVLLLLLCVFQTGVSSLLFVEVPSLMPLVGLAALFTILAAVPTGLLQGLQRFRMLALTMVLYPVVRVVAGVVLVALGMSIAGGLWGTIAGIIAGLVAGIGPLIFTRSRPPSGAESDDDADATGSSVSIDSHVVFSVITAFCLAVPTVLDIVLVKHYFPIFDVGLYSSAATLGKILVFVPTTIGMVMVPIVASRHAVGQSAKKIFAASLAGTLVCASGAALFFVAFARVLLSAAFDQSFLPATEVVQWYGVAIIPYCLVFVIAQYCLAMDKFKYAMALLGYFVVEVLGICLFHSSLLQVVHVLAIVNAAFAVGSVVFLMVARDRASRAEKADANMPL